MKILKLKQGSEEWLRERAKYHCSSDAPAMMGVSPHLSRADLVRMSATGDESEHGQYAREVLFPNGHAIEAAARPIAETMIGEDLYPTVGASDDGKLLASFDGLTILGADVWECKQWNEAKAALVRAGRVPPEDHWQVVQQLVVSGAQRCHYTVTNGTAERYVTTAVTLHADDALALSAGWEQFDRDVAAYIPRGDDPQPVGIAPERLPALAVEVVGNVVSSNLQEFERTALGVFAKINRDLQTDDDFADAEQTVTWCKAVEGKLELAKEQALAQTPTIDELFRTIDSIKETSRAIRIELDKLVKARKQAVRGEIVQSVRDAYTAHVYKLTPTLGRFNGEPAPLALEPVDFGAPLKGLKTISSLRDAAETALAQAKLAANAQADRMRANVARLNELATDQTAIFADWRELVTKQPADMESAIKLRLMLHEAKERDRREAAEREKQAEAERIRAEYEAKAKEQKSSAVKVYPPSAMDAPNFTYPPRVTAAAMAEAEPDSRREALDAWRARWEVSHEAYTALLCILARTGTVAQEAL